MKRPVTFAVLWLALWVVDRVEAGERRVVAVTDHFQIESDIDAVDLGELPRLLEALDSTLAREFSARPRDRRVIVLYASQGEMVDGVVNFVPVKDAAEREQVKKMLTARLIDTWGMYESMSKTARVVWFDGASNESLHSALHESTHQFLNQSGVESKQTSSKAYKEGIAEYWSQYRIEDGKAVFGDETPRLDSITEAYRLGAEHHFDLGSIATSKGHLPGVDWAFVTFLKHAAPETFAAWVNDTAEPADLPAAWARHFDARPELNEQFKKWVVSRYERQPLTSAVGDWQAVSPNEVRCARRGKLVSEAALKRLPRTVRITSDVKAPVGEVGLIVQDADALNFTRVSVRSPAENGESPTVHVDRFVDGRRADPEGIMPVEVADISDLTFDLQIKEAGQLAIKVNGQPLVTLPKARSDATRIYVGNDAASFNIEYADEPRP